MPVAEMRRDVPAVRRAFAAVPLTACKARRTGVTGDLVVIGPDCRKLRPSLDAALGAERVATGAATLPNLEVLGRTGQYAQWQQHLSSGPSHRTTDRSYTAFKSTVALQPLCTATAPPLSRHASTNPSYGRRWRREELVSSCAQPDAGVLLYGFSCFFPAQGAAPAVGHSYRPHRSGPPRCRDRLVAAQTRSWLRLFVRAIQDRDERPLPAVVPADASAA